MNSIRVTQLPESSTFGQRFLGFFMAFPMGIGLAFLLEWLGFYSPYIVWAPFWILVVFNGINLLPMGRKHPRAVVNQAFRDAAPGRIEKLIWYSTDSGIAVGRDFVIVLERGFLGMIPLSEIRNAWWTVEGYDVRSVWGYGTAAWAAQWEADRANRAAEYNAWINSGFFFRVKDANKPLWQFQTANQTHLMQIEEMIAQAMERQSYGAAKAS